MPTADAIVQHLLGENAVGGMTSADACCEDKAKT